MTALTDHSSAKPQRTVLSVDAMGGDQGPAVVVAGLAQSAKINPDIRFILHGPSGNVGPFGAEITTAERSLRNPQCDRCCQHGRQTQPGYANGKGTSMGLPSNRCVKATQQLPYRAATPAL